MPLGLDNLRYIVVLMMENRSFDQRNFRDSSILIRTITSRRSICRSLVDRACVNSGKWGCDNAEPVHRSQSCVNRRELRRVAHTTFL